MPASGHVRTIHTLDNGCNPPCQQNTADFRAGLGNFNKNLTFLASHGRCTRQSATWYSWNHMAVCQNLVPLVNIKIAGKWMFIPLKMVLIGIDPYPYFFSPWWMILVASFVSNLFLHGCPPQNPPLTSLTSVGRSPSEKSPRNVPQSCP